MTLIGFLLVFGSYIVLERNNPDNWNDRLRPCQPCNPAPSGDRVFRVIRRITSVLPQNTFYVKGNTSVGVIRRITPRVVARVPDACIYAQCVRVPLAYSQSYTPYNVAVRRAAVGYALACCSRARVLLTPGPVGTKKSPTACAVGLWITCRSCDSSKRSLRATRC